MLSRLVDALEVPPLRPSSEHKVDFRPPLQDWLGGPRVPPCRMEFVGQGHGLETREDKARLQRPDSAAPALVFEPLFVPAQDACVDADGGEQRRGARAGASR